MISLKSTVTQLYRTPAVRRDAWEVHNIFNISTKSISNNLSVLNHLLERIHFTSINEE